MCSKEWDHVIKRTAGKLQACIQNEYPELSSADFLWSMDNATSHKHPLPQVHGRQIPLPPRSPDLHKVVEHAIGRIKRKFKIWMRTHPGSPTVGTAWKELKEIARAQCTPDIITRDVDSLRGTYISVLSAKGLYPPKQFR